MAAFAEPLSVCLHAVKRAGPLLGKRVLVTGSGPIGILTMIAAKAAGAAEIVATDVVDGPLPTALADGRRAAIDVMAEPERLKADYGAEKGAFDVMFEASGNQHALTGAFDVVRPGGDHRADRRRRPFHPADERAGRQGVRPARLLPLP